VDETPRPRAANGDRRRAARAAIRSGVAGLIVVVILIIGTWPVPAGGWVILAVVVVFAFLLEWLRQYWLLGRWERRK
jgi:uncharacterized membrane protein YccC